MFDKLKHIHIIFFVMIGINNIFAQSDSVQERSEGLYLDYIQFRNNQPIKKIQIITDIDTSQLDFFTKLVAQKEITIKSLDGNIRKLLSKDLWGYYQNDNLYIYIDNDFYKVPVLGAISYFIGTQEVTYYSGMGMGYPYGMGGGIPVKTREMKELLLDYYTGKVYPFSMDNLEELLKRDSDIYNQFIQLSNKQKKKKYTYYIRMFNEKHKVR